MILVIYENDHFLSRPSAQFIGIMLKNKQLLFITFFKSFLLESSI